MEKLISAVISEYESRERPKLLETDPAEWSTYKKKRNTLDKHAVEKLIEKARDIQLSLTEYPSLLLIRELRSIKNALEESGLPNSIEITSGKLNRFKEAYRFSDTDEEREEVFQEAVEYFNGEGLGSPVNPLIKRLSRFF